MPHRKGTTIFSDRLLTRATGSDSMNAATRQKALGYTAALTTVCIWGSWLVLTRLGVTTTLTAADTAFLRFAIATALLTPLVLMKGGVNFKELGFKRFCLLTITGGGAFLFIVSIGMRFAPMADVAAMLPGAMPIFVTLFSIIFLKERIGFGKTLALMTITGGVLVFAWEGLANAGDGRWLGHVLLLTGSALWAVFTLLLRGAALTAVQAAFVVNLGSLVFAPLFFWWSGSNLLNAPINDILVQGIAQGVMSGVIAMITYAAAVRLVGSAAALFAALVPGIATLVGIPVLGETPGSFELAAIGIICIGLAWSAKAK